MHKLRGLFVTHDITNYGAPRSLQLLLSNYHEAHIDLIARKDLTREDIAPEEIRRRFGAHIENIAHFYMPYDFCCLPKPVPTLRNTTAGMVYDAIWRIRRKEFYAFIKEGGYDFVHLNSFPLHPVITEEFPFIMHMREIYDGTNPGAIADLQKTRGVIFIDEATRAPFQNVSLPPSIVLNNPFDMTALKGYTGRVPIGPGEEVGSKVIFSLIGRITEEKGTEFIIRCFMKMRNDDVRLLIVGSGEKAYMKYCKDLSKDDRRIIFWGEEDDIMRIYSISDYILRGEPYQCIGRTIYEGLYGGCGVIIPGDDNDADKIFEYEKFKESIFLYRPRNETDLLAIFNRLSRAKVVRRGYSSNIEEYIKKFHAFVSTIAASARKH